jgi:small multidrug resistance pump
LDVEGIFGLCCAQLGILTKKSERYLDEYISTIALGSNINAGIIPGIELLRNNDIAPHERGFGLFLFWKMYRRWLSTIHFTSGLRIVNGSFRSRTTMTDLSTVAFSASYGSTYSEEDFTNDDSDSRHDDGDRGYKYWIYLIVAILLEVAGTTSMKLSDGFTNLIPSLLIYFFYGLSLALFPLSLKGIELSTAYAIWSGLGTTLTCVIGFCYFSDTINLTKITALAAIIGGCAVLKFADD